MTEEVMQQARAAGGLIHPFISASDATFSPASLERFAVLVVKKAVAQLEQDNASLREQNTMLDARLAEIETAIRKTLDENGHLADGENCTLAELKRVMGGEA